MITYKAYKDRDGTRCVGVYYSKLFIGSYYLDDRWGGEAMRANNCGSIYSKDVECVVKNEEAARRKIVDWFNRFLQKHRLILALFNDDIYSQPSMMKWLQTGRRT